MIFVLSVYGQDKMSSYKSTAVKGEYDVSISFGDKPKKNRFDLYIDTYTTEATWNENCGIMLTEKQHVDFVSSLQGAKKLYNEWVDVAKKNDVKDLTKDMTKLTVSVGAYFNTTKWHFDWSNNLTFTFMVKEISDKVEYWLIMGTGKLTASDNQYIDHKGPFVVLSSSEEIDELLNAISLDKINEFEKSKSSKEELFTE